tara:strand:- start:187 stop:528 length:342 start_codon:yes stop_codon:yes gene_type:complete
MMIILPKNWTGVSIKNNGDIIYKKLSIFLIGFFVDNLLKRKKSQFLINEKIKSVIEKFSILQIIIAIFFASSMKSFNDFRASIVIIFVYFLLASFLIILQNNYVIKRATKIKE